MLKLVLLLGSSSLLVAQGPGPVPDYGGPAVLSRGGPASSLNGTPDIAFRPYIGIAGTYYGGLTTPGVDSAGNVQSSHDIGVEADFGVYGRHNFRHTLLGLTYQGDVLHFPGNSFQDATDQMLTLAITHQLSKRFSVSFQEAGGTYKRNYAFTTAAGLIDPSSLNLPSNDLFDNRVIYGETTGQLIMQVTSHLSVSLGGSGFLVRRRSSSLYGATGYTASADVAYRVSKYFTLGTSYNFTHFEFTKAFGGSSIHSASLFAATRLSRTVELSLGAGGSRVETLFTAAVAVDPVIAAITGQTSGIQAFYGVHYIPTLSARLTKQWKLATAIAAYDQAVTPGNGVYLTSRTTTASVGFTYTAARYWHFGADVGYTRYAAVAQSLGTYEGYSAGFGVSRVLGHGLQAVFRADERRYATNYNGYSQNLPSASLGITWSPGEIPLSLW